MPAILFVIVDYCYYCYHYVLWNKQRKYTSFLFCTLAMWNIAFSLSLTKVVVPIVEKFFKSNIWNCIQLPYLYGNVTSWLYQICVDTRKQFLLVGQCNVRVSNLEYEDWFYLLYFESKLLDISTPHFGRINFSIS